MTRKQRLQEIARLIREWVQSEWELREFSEITVDEGRAFTSHALALAQHLEPRLFTEDADSPLPLAAVDPYAADPGTPTPRDVKAL